MNANHAAGQQSRRSAEPLHKQRSDAAERVRVARTMAAAFPCEANDAELAAAMAAFNLLRPNHDR